MSLTVTAPVMRGVMRRRVLVNFRIRLEAMKPILPSPFRPQLVNGWAMGGICLIRLEKLHPICLPIGKGSNSENAAHRIAVEWDDAHGTRRGVYVPRRDTSSRLNFWIGGRLFPGLHHLADFSCVDDGDVLSVKMRSRDGEADVAVAGKAASSLPDGSVFASLDAASEFFRCGSCGWSPGIAVGSFDGLELQTDRWEIAPLEVHQAASSFFEDVGQFPKGSVEFDSAFVMRDIDHEWHPIGGLQLKDRSIIHPHRHAAFFELP